ncbi:lanthionine synthetase C family protein [Streptomyces graminilatus]|uniref:lanthionine synthetase C family protein n=1 Tax=Streptomyces graminilatus TaxID=1464070 RepID=UPI000AA4BCBA|nr:lanthionine synthetase C family protein [Streptomyces graminilatus]
MSSSTTGAGLSPGTVHGGAAHGLRAQSLARGAAGIALLHVERAQRGTGSWADAHTVLASCANGLIADEDASLYFGAPAVAFALHTASLGTGRYTKALHTLDAQIDELTRRRIAAAHARIDRGERPRLGEFDLFYGLTGLGSYLLCRDPHGETLREVLTYLVRITWPLEGDAEQLPGWWTEFDPSGSLSQDFPGGHGNLGMAHGVSGILSLLAISARRGTVVDGQIAAMQRICTHLDDHRQDTGTGVWWPQWVTLGEHRTQTVAQKGPARPSWCYGTPGLVSAQRLAALTLGDTARQHMAEQALLSCLADPAQLARIRDAGICHGAAGLLHTARRIAHEAAETGLEEHLPRLYALLQDQEPADEDGFLDGRAGRELAAMAYETESSTATGWDACLLSG